MVRTLILILALFILPTTSVATEAQQTGWRAEITSLISHQQYEEAGEKLKDYCLNKRASELCLTMASAHFEGEAKLGIESRDIVKAYQYTKLACDYGSQAGCEASKAAIEKGELVKNILFEPGVENREEQLRKARNLGANLNSTILFSTTLLQKAISDENIEVVKLLLANGVAVNYRVSNEDLTPLMYAINSGSKEIVTLLLENGADPNQTMKAADYLKMGKDEINACDFARKLENTELTALLRCKVAASVTE